MTTLGQLVDRTLRDWLEPADDQPTRASLAAGLAVDATSLTYDPAMLSPEEEELLGPGTLIQIGAEEILVGDIDETTNTLSDLKRAQNGTVPTVHAAGDLIFPTPVWRRRAVVDALGDAIVKLYPELYRILSSNEMSLSSTSYTEVPAAVARDLVAVKHFLGSCSSTSGYEAYTVRLLSPFPAVSSGKAVVVDAASSVSGYLVYKAKFARPTSENDDLTVFGVQQDWEQIVILDAVAYLIAGREMDLATQERLSQQLEQQGYPAGTPSQVRDSILRYRELMVNRAQDALRVEHPVTVSTVASL